MSNANKPLYAVFVDYKAAFDTVPRTRILEKLARAGVGGKMFNLIMETLQEGDVAIEDGVSELAPFRQCTGVAQGDNHSPL